MESETQKGFQASSILVAQEKVPKCSELNHRPQKKNQIRSLE
jgi:hypothetical protein